MKDNTDMDTQKPRHTTMEDCAGPFVVALQLGHINVVGDILVVAKALKRVLLKVCVEVAYARWDRERVQELISDA